MNLRLYQVERENESYDDDDDDDFVAASILSIYSKSGKNTIVSFLFLAKTLCSRMV